MPAKASSPPSEPWTEGAHPVNNSDRTTTHGAIQIQQLRGIAYDLLADYDKSRTTVEIAGSKLRLRVVGIGGSATVR